MMYVERLCYCAIIVMHLLVPGIEARQRLLGKSSIQMDHAPRSTDSHLEEKRSLQQENRELLAVESQLGSRPPTCKNKCNACFPCEAVQVPTPGQNGKTNGAPFSSSASIHINYSNYQPEGWKCKCGNRYFNP